MNAKFYSEPINGEKKYIMNELIEERAKALFRRFIPIGTAEEIDKFLSLAEEKNLSREDLHLILRAIRLNPDISW